MAGPGGRTTRVIGIALGMIIMGGGIAKLAGESHQVASFLGWGLPIWFLRLVGTFEVIGGILLAIPDTTPIGSLVLSTILVGALWAHAANRDWLHIAPAAILLPLMLWLFRQSRDRAVRLLGSL